MIISAVSTMKKAATGVVLCISLATQAFAIPMSEVVIGSRYSISAMGENPTGIVIKKNSASGSTLIRYDHNQRTEWVKTSRLLRTEVDSWGDDITETGAWLVVGAAVLCALSDECGNAETNTRSSASTNASAGHELIIENSCHEEVSINITYMKPDGSWNKNAGYWRYSPHEEASPLIKKNLVRVKGNNVFIYATSKSYQWNGLKAPEKDRWSSNTGKVMVRSNTFIENNRRKLELTCA